MATVVGIFEDHFLWGKKLPVVRPGTQLRRFTHIFDTVKACIFAWKKNNCKHYSIANNQSYSIIELAKMFKSKIRYLPKREGERFASALTNMNLNNKIIRLSAKIRLKDYINNFLMNNR
jgi:UDP-glucose 4-epimerase